MIQIMYQTLIKVFGIDHPTGKFLVYQTNKFLSSYGAILMNNKQNKDCTGLTTTPRIKHLVN